MRTANPNPTYGTGFARNKAECIDEFKWMWDGVVFAAGMFLGPTGQLMDWSGNANHGVLTNMDVTDWQGDALDFLGTDEYVSLGNNIFSSAELAEGSVSVLFNLRSDANADTDVGIVSIEDQVALRYNETTNKTRTNVNDGVSHYMDSITSIILNEWYKFVLTWDGTNARMYLNGQFENSVAAGSPDLTPDRDVRIGTNAVGPGGDQFFDGLIRQVLIHNRTLTPSEVAAWSANPKGLFVRKPPISYFVPAVLKNYSRGDELTLPADDTDLETAFTAEDITDVETDNNVYVDQSGNSGVEPFVLFEFKDEHPDSLGIIIVQCIAKSDRAPSLATVTLQIFNRNTVEWEVLDSNNAAAADTEFTLDGVQSTNLSDYYDGSNIVACRVYQEAAA